MTLHQHGKPLPVFCLGRGPEASRWFCLGAPQPCAGLPLTLLFSASQPQKDLVVPLCLGRCPLHRALHPHNTAWILGLSSSLSSETPGHFVRTIGGHVGILWEPHYQSHWTSAVQVKSGYKPLGPAPSQPIPPGVPIALLQQASSVLVHSSFLVSPTNVDPGLCGSGSTAPEVALGPAESQPPCSSARPLMPSCLSRPVLLPQGSPDTATPWLSCRAGSDSALPPFLPSARQT